MTEASFAMGLPPPPARAESRMLRVVVLWVEGRLDQRFWARMVRAESCRVRVAGGWEPVVQLMATVTAEDPVLGVIDADLRHHRGLPAPPGVILTDLANLEVMLLDGQGLAEILTHLLPDRSREVSALVEEVWRSAEFLGRLRLHNEVQDLRLSFKTGRKKDEPLDYGKLCPREDGVLDENRALVYLWRDLNHRGAPPPDLLAVLRSLPVSDHRLVVNGHDLVGLAVLSARAQDGSLRVTADQLAELACIRWSIAELRMTHMGAAVAAWEQERAPGRVLRPR